MCLSGALCLTTGCDLYDGALLFSRQSAAPVSAPYDDATTAADAGFAPGAGSPGTLQEPQEAPTEVEVSALPLAAGGAGGMHSPGGTGAAATGGGAVAPAQGGAGAGPVAGSAGQVAAAAGVSGGRAAAGSGGSTTGSGGGGGSSASAGCTETGARRWTDNGHCYIPIDQTQSWNLSRDRCVALGARLVTITSPAEQLFVADLLGARSRWLGLSKFGAPAFSWISGAPLDYTHWQAGAPAATGEVAALVRADTQEWVDESISTAHAALCERP